MLRRQKFESGGRVVRVGGHREEACSRCVKRGFSLWVSCDRERQARTRGLTVIPLICKVRL